MIINPIYKILIVAIFLFLPSLLLQAQEMNGLWKGQFDYKTVGKDQVFSVEMYYYTVGDKLYGIGASYPNEGNSSGIKNTKWKVEGEWNGDNMTYTVSEIIHYKGTSNLCQTKCNYKLSQVGDKLQLLGKCQPTGYGFDKNTFELVDGNNCKPIDITLNRKNNQSMYITLDEIEKLKEKYEPQKPIETIIETDEIEISGATNEPAVPQKPVAVDIEKATTLTETTTTVTTTTETTNNDISEEKEVIEVNETITTKTAVSTNKTPKPTSGGVATYSKKRKVKLNKNQRNRQRKIKNLSRRKKAKFDDCPF